MKAYRSEILMGAGELENLTEAHKLPYCIDYCDTVNSNIRLFLRDKPHKIEFRLENAANAWSQFWDWVEAEGDWDESVKEWQIEYNASRPQ